MKIKIIYKAKHRVKIFCDEAPAGIDLYRFPWNVNKGTRRIGYTGKI
jgi:hypothetical protein